MSSKFSTDYLLSMSTCQDLSLQHSMLHCFSGVNTGGCDGHLGSSTAPANNCVPAWWLICSKISLYQDYTFQFCMQQHYFTS